MVARRGPPSPIRFLDELQGSSGPCGALPDLQQLAARHAGALHPVGEPKWAPGSWLLASLGLVRARPAKHRPYQTVQKVQHPGLSLQKEKKHERQTIYLQCGVLVLLDELCLVLHTCGDKLISWKKLISKPGRR